MSTEVEKNEVADKKDNKLKKVAIMAKKELKRTKDKAKKFVKEHAAEGAVALATMGAVAPTMSNAQSYQDIRDNSVELHMNADGTTSVRRNTSQAAAKSQTRSSSRQQAASQQATVTYINTVGERITVPVQIRHGNSMLVFSDALTYGVDPQYAGAYVNPNESGLRPSQRHVYYAKGMLDGVLEVKTTWMMNSVYNGNGPYVIPFSVREAVLQGRGQGGFVLVRDGNPVMDVIYTVDAATRGIARIKGNIDRIVNGRPHRHH